MKKTQKYLTIIISILLVTVILVLTVRSTDPELQALSASDDGADIQTLEIISADAGDEDLSSAGSDRGAEDAEDAAAEIDPDYEYAEYDLCTLIVEGEIAEEDKDHISYEDDGIYALTYDTEEEAAKIMEKYEDLPDCDVSYDLMAYILDDGSEDYSFLSYGPDLMNTSYLVYSILNKYESADDMPRISVAVLDTGVDYTHPFLKDRIGSHDYDTCYNDNDAMDDNGHGSHVAGIIADATLSNVVINAYKIADSIGYTTSIMIANAIKQAVEDGADIINLSIGGYFDPEKDSTQLKLIESAIDLANDNGALVCVAAGNTSLKHPGVQDTAYDFPAYYEPAFTVSAVNSKGVFDSGYSYYGQSVDVSAPGTDIYSTVLNGRYAYKDGTSMAAPAAAAAAALVMTYFGCTAHEAGEYLKQYARDEGDEGFDVYYGNGIVDLSGIVDPSAPSFTLSEAAGEYKEGITLTVESSGVWTDILYTTDGSDPLAEGETVLECEGAVDISESSLIRIAARAGLREKDSTGSEITISSEEVSGRYYIGEDPLDLDYTLDQDGIITQYCGSRSSLLIPQTVNGIQVKGLGAYVFAGAVSDGQEIVITDNIGYIGSWAFGTVKDLSITIKGLELALGEYPLATAATVSCDYNNSAFDILRSYGYTITGSGECSHYFEEDGTYEDPHELKRCIRCGFEKTIHENILYFTAFEASCSHVGWDAYKICEDCGFTTYSEIQAEDHDWILVSGISPSGTAAGYSDHYICSKCKAVKDYELILPDNAEVIKRVEASCDEDGYVEYVISSSAEIGEVLEFNELQLSAESCEETQPEYADPEDIQLTDTEWDGTEGSEEAAALAEAESEAQTEAESEIESGTEAQTAAGNETQTEAENENEAQPETEAACENETEELGNAETEGAAETEEINAGIYESYTAVLPKTGHDQLVYVSSSPATCTEDGIKTGYFYCEKCGKCYKADDELSLIEDISEYVISKKGHLLEHIEAKEATCTEDGNIEYYKCSECARLFKDQDALTEISADDAVIKAAGHNGVEVCEKEADCTEKGRINIVCSSCEELLGGYDLDALGHDLEHVEAKAASCVEAGNIEYWYCKRCGRYFSDENCKNEMADGEAATVIEATGIHDYYLSSYKEETCTEDGSREYICRVCANKKTELSPAPGHSLKHVNAVAAGYDKQGNTEYYRCERCGRYFEDSDGCSEISSSQIFYYKRPETVTLKAVSASSSGITISWNKASGADKYVIYRRTADSSWTRLGSCAADSKKSVFSAIDRTASKNTVYYYTVRAYNSTSGLLGSYDTKGLCALIWGKVKAACTAETNGITVSWNSVKAADKYRIYRKVSGGSYKKLKDVSGSLSSYTDTTAAAGKLYYYVVVGYNSKAKTFSSYSAAKGGWLSTPSLKVSALSGGMYVKWSKVTGAKKYVIYRKVYGGSWKKLKVVSSSYNYYLDKSVKSGTKYYYCVKAYTAISGKTVLSGGKSKGAKAK